MELGEHGVSEGVQRRLGLELRGLAVDDVVQEEHPICFGHSGCFLRTKALLRSDPRTTSYCRFYGAACFSALSLQSRGLPAGASHHCLYRRRLFLRFLPRSQGTSGGSQPSSPLPPHVSPLVVAPRVVSSWRPNYDELYIET